MTSINYERINTRIKRFRALIKALYSKHIISYNIYAKLQDRLDEHWESKLWR